MTAIEYFNHGEIFRDSGACDVVSIPLGGGTKMLMLSGVAAENPDGTFGQANPAAADIAGQVAFVWERISALLKAHDASLDNIVKVTFYTTDSRYLMDPIATSLGANFTGRTRRCRRHPRPPRSPQRPRQARSRPGGARRGSGRSPRLS